MMMGFLSKFARCDCFLVVRHCHFPCDSGGSKEKENDLQKQPRTVQSYRQKHHRHSGS